MAEEHEMRLENTRPDGSEEWLCPICGRRFLLRWPPQYKKTILEAGDESAIHNGRSPGGATPAEPPSPDEPRPELQAGEDDPSLLPWLEWMERVDFESLWRTPLP